LYIEGLDVVYRSETIHGLDIHYKFHIIYGTAEMLVPL